MTDFISEVNPVTNSAKGNLMMLSELKIPEAEMFAEYLRFNLEFKKSRNGFEEKLTHCFAVIQALRYKSLTTYAEKFQIKNIVDLGCGYSPRGYYFKNKSDFKYIGIDLPAIVKNLMHTDNALTYIAADLTNLSSLQKAMKDVSGSVLLVTEGVLSYFTENELKTVIGNIHSILFKHGGMWITPDFYNNDVVSAVMKPVFGDEVFQKIQGILGSMKKTEVGTEFRKDEIPVFVQGHDILAEFGFSEKKLPFLTGDAKAYFLSDFSLDVQKNIISNYEKFCQSVLYINENYPEINEFKVENGVKVSSDFNMNIQKSGTSYEFFLRGRLDTISSPKLLEIYEKILKDKQGKEIIVNCQNLDYISSAGIRVLLIMYNSSNKKLRVINQNEIVDEILEQTGLKEIFCR